MLQSQKSHSASETVTAEWDLHYTHRPVYSRAPYQSRGTPREKHQHEDRTPLSWAPKSCYDDLQSPCSSGQVWVCNLSFCLALTSRAVIIRVTLLVWFQIFIRKPIVEFVYSTADRHINSDFISLVNVKAPLPQSSECCQCTDGNMKGTWTTRPGVCRTISLALFVVSQRLQPPDKLLVSVRENAVQRPAEALSLSGSLSEIRQRGEKQLAHGFKKKKRGFNWVFICWLQAVAHMEKACRDLGCAAC